MIEEEKSVGLIERQVDQVPAQVRVTRPDQDIEAMEIAVSMSRYWSNSEPTGTGENAGGKASGFGYQCPSQIRVGVAGSTP